MHLKELIRSRPGRAKLAALGLRLALGLVFVYAGYTKLRRPWYVFAGMIDNYGVVAPSVSEVVARVLPPMEVVLGVALLAGLYRRISSAAGVVLLFPFFALMIWAYARGMKIDCGCFGPGQMLGPRTILRDGILLVASLWFTVLCWRSKSEV